MRAHLFTVRGDSMVYALTYGGETRVWMTGIVDMHPVSASKLVPDSTWANGDEEAWGRLILEQRQGGLCLVLPRCEPARTITISGDLVR